MGKQRCYTADIRKETDVISTKHLCGVFRKDVDVNKILYQSWKKLPHKQCSEI